MLSFGVVIDQPFSDAGAGFLPSLKAVQTHPFVLEDPLQPLNHSVVNPPPFAMHAYLYLRIIQQVDPTTTGELAALVGVEYL